MMKGRLRDLTLGMDGSQIVSIAIDSDFRESFDALKDAVVSVIIKKFRNKRSLEANRYAWELIGQISKKKQVIDPKGGWTPEKVYRKAIKDTRGIYTVTGMKNDAIDMFEEAWTEGHIGRWIEVLDNSSREGWSNVKIYYGSSDYDSAEMALFINSVIQDAESLGIPTVTEKEAMKMIGDWKKGEKKSETPDEKAEVPA